MRPARKAARKQIGRQPMSREGRWTLIACAGSSILLAGAVFLASGILPDARFGLPSGQFGRPGALPINGAGGSGSSAMDSDDGLRTGSILFVPNEGNICRRRLIDNRTWRIRDGGAVICNEAVAWNANVVAGRLSPAARLDAIRGGFQKK
ncbi:MAG: hypothetical protein HXY30_02565 [Pseudorhodoplanes sp.]|nr:hypothetical protein [Pseudorhodoplanes sp.]